MKKVINLNQRDLNNLVTEAVKRIVNEDVAQGPTGQVGQGIDSSLPGLQKPYNSNPNQVPTSQQLNGRMQSDKQMAIANLKKWGYKGQGSWIPLAVKNGLTDQEINTMRNALTGTPGKFNANYSRYRTTPQLQYGAKSSGTQIGSNMRGEKTMKNMYESNGQMNENVAAIAKAVLPYVERYIIATVVEKGAEKVSGKFGNKDKNTGNKENSTEKNIHEAVTRVIKRNIR